MFDDLGRLGRESLQAGTLDEKRPVSVFVVGTVEVELSDPDIAAGSMGGLRWPS
jgi:hypothetical protein